jgi:hypothetical protein
VRKARRIPVAPPEPERTPKHDRSRSAGSNNSLAPPPQTHRPRTPSIDQQLLTPTPASTPDRARIPARSPEPSHAISPPDGIMVVGPVHPQAQVAMPAAPGSPGRPQSDISTDTSRKGYRRSIIDYFRTSRLKERKFGPLPDSLTFTFSATGQSILLWRRNGHSLVRIQVQDRTSCSLPLINALPAFEGDRSVAIKTIHEGREWIAIILYYKQVLLTS